MDEEIHTHDLETEIRIKMFLRWIFISHVIAAE